MRPRQLFVASCVALVTSAFSFVIRQDVLPAWGETFNLSKTQLGTIGGLAFQGMALSMLFGAPVCDKLGMKMMVGFAFLCHLLGTAATIGLPFLGMKGDSAFYILAAATFLVGAANGFVEIGVNPLAATLYPTQKTRMLNILHAWWPGGLMMGGLIALGITKALGLGLGGVGADSAATQFGWQVKMALIFIPMLIYGVIFLTQSFPVTERVASGITTKEMFSEGLRPMFLLWAFCMLLTSATELAPQGMQSLVLEKTAKMDGTIILIYTSLLMFIGRYLAGPVAHALSPVGMLTGSAVLAAAGLYALSFAYDTATALGAATIFGLGIVYFWPTMLGVTAERFPKGGALLLGLMGCIGNIAVGTAQPVMGKINDSVTASSLSSDVRAKVVVDGTLDPEKAKTLTADEKVDLDHAQSEGAKWSFRYVSGLPVILVVVFGAIALSDRAKGGYKPEELPAATVATDY